MISVDEARTRILSALHTLPAETLSLMESVGRTLAAPVVATRTQPPADFSAMDGYAIRTADLTQLPQTLHIIGESRAGHGFDGTLSPECAVRIFTGAPTPAGSDAVVIQEDVVIAENGRIEIRNPVHKGQHIRHKGLDFSRGDCILPAGTYLGPRQIALAASANVGWLSVSRRPRIALLSTGDELVRPGQSPGKDSIIDSITPALAAFISQNGAQPQILDIAQDTIASVKRAASAASDCDLMVTIGGASVGDYDLVQSGFGELGMGLDFWKIAMRPGKPLIFGKLGQTPILGLPGNPVSALMTALLFLGPAIDRMLGRTVRTPMPVEAELTTPLPANGSREAWLRADMTTAGGRYRVTPHMIQDSSVQSTLATANALIRRSVNAAKADAGAIVEVLPLDPAFAF